LNIGLTQRVLYHKSRAYDSIEHAWYRFLDGHKPVFIPNTLDQDFSKLTDEIDCLIITGGDDSTIRRATELKLASAMMMAYKPIIGICHGSFLLSDTLGGSIGAVSAHDNTEHAVNYFGQKIIVNSFHNQTIKTLHSTGKSLCADINGNCEAWIDGRIAGITWHPERMAEPFIPAEIQQILKL